MTTHTVSPTHRGRRAPAPDPQLAQTSSAGSRLLVAEDVAALLGVSPAFVYALVRRGELPAVRVGDRYVRFRAEAVRDWIAERESTDRRGTQ